MIVFFGNSKSYPGTMVTTIKNFQFRMDSNNTPISANLKYFISEFHQKEKRIYKLQEWLTEEDFGLLSRVRSILASPIRDIPESVLEKLLETIESRLSKAYSRKLSHFLKDIEYNPEWVQEQ